ncbi:hypothetical protein A2U01_0015674, partial [Trifolium medium]|nr:hypothetical protein [Trifolium medium]
VLIPFASGSNYCAVLGPFTLKKDLRDVETFFPRHPVYPILAFKELIDTSFFREVVHNNRAMPLETGLIFPNYRAWFMRLQPAKSEFWKSIGIYNLIEATTKPVSTNYPQILSSLYFWDPVNCVFQTPHGMMSISMSDVAAIVGLNPYGETFHPDRQSANILEVNMDKNAYSSFMTNNKAQCV